MTRDGWDYRVIVSDRGYAIHEVYYADDGNVWGISADPMSPVVDNLDELRVELSHLLKALHDPIINHDDATMPWNRSNDE